MIELPGGTFRMGSEKHYPEEAPIREVTVGPFAIDPYPVTNRQFAEFVSATGHITVAERTPSADLYPGADPSLLVPASVVFVRPGRPVDLGDHLQWWKLVPGANWKQPDGKGSNLSGAEDYPVVHVAFEDAVAYAGWAGKSLPTEAEWEYAARGGLVGEDYAWGSTFTVEGKFMANTWQGDFPNQNLKLDGYVGRAPVGQFPANAFGLFDMIGNVWEWTITHYDAPNPASPCCGEYVQPGGGLPRRATKGGSFLCAPNYCQRYRPAARMPQSEDTSTCHLGFRCIVRR